MQKHLLKKRYEEEQELAKEEWKNIRSHSGSLLFSGIKEFIFPHHKRHAPRGNASHHSKLWQEITDNLPFYLATVNESIAIIWHMTRPLYLRWLINRRKK